VYNLYDILKLIEIYDIIVRLLQEGHRLITTIDSIPSVFLLTVRIHIRLFRSENTGTCDSSY